MTTTAHSAGATPLTDEQIDRAVSERVMGWHYEQIDAGGGAYHARWYDDSGNLVFRYMVSEHSVLGTRWRPSTSIADAWRVLEKFQSTHNIYLVTIEKYRWCCDLEGANGAAPAGGDEHVSEMAETAPRAICLAALAAVQA